MTEPTGNRRKMHRRTNCSLVVLLLACSLGQQCSLSGAEEPAVAEAPRQGKVLAEVAGKYGRLQVAEIKGVRMLVCGDVVQSAIPTEGIALTPQQLVRSRDFVGLVPYYRPHIETALVIGLGAGLHAQALSNIGIHVHSVDIEPAVIPLARQYFGFEGKVTVGDGRTFLDECEQRFEVIVLDVFLGSEVPEQLFTIEAFRRMAACLSHKGIVAVHLITKPRHRATDAVGGTLKQIFSHTVAVRSGFDQGLQHVYLFASNRPLALGSEQRLKLDAAGFTGDEFFIVDTKMAPVLTDKCTDLKLWCKELGKEHLLRSQEILGRTR